jgi:hypothetical protein
MEGIDVRDRDRKNGNVLARDGRENGRGRRHRSADRGCSAQGEGDGVVILRAPPSPCRREIVAAPEGTQNCRIATGFFRPSPRASTRSKEPDFDPRILSFFGRGTSIHSARCSRRPQNDGRWHGHRQNGQPTQPDPQQTSSSAGRIAPGGGPSRFCGSRSGFSAASSSRSFVSSIGAEHDAQIRPIRHPRGG